MKAWLRKQVLWLRHRNEWSKVRERVIGSRPAAFDLPNSPLCDLIEQTWYHPEGHIRTTKVLR